MPLYWDVYLPSPTPPPGVFWPVVILVEDGGFENGRRCDHQLKCIARDLTASNFAVVSIDIRHDKIHDNTHDDPCQTVPAYAPQFNHKQVGDLKKAIKRARNPGSGSILSGKVNQKVGAIGGSGGGAHVAWCAATGTVGSLTDDKLDAAVCLSGAYEFDNLDSLNTHNQCNPPCSNPIYGFCENVTAYCNVLDYACPPGTMPPPAALTLASPIYQIDADDVDTAPLYAFATFQDYMPNEQFDEICDRLQRFNGTGECPNLDGDRYKATEFNAMSGHKHSFAYWFDDTGAGNVNDLAKTFLCDKLNAPSPCPQ